MSRGSLTAAASGLLAVGAALGVGHLVAGLVSVPESSPFVAVGNAAIDRTPAPVKDFAITTFGTADKPALLVGMAVVLALLGAAIGLASRRSRWPGLVSIAVLGGIGLLAVYEQSAQRVGLLAPTVALAAGLASFWGLHAWARPDEPAA
ncbi:molybdopterin-binding oxidoreductase, partial [Micromonospora sp. WMMD736]